MGFPDFSVPTYTPPRHLPGRAKKRLSDGILTFCTICGDHGISFSVEDGTRLIELSYGTLFTNPTTGMEIGSADSIAAVKLFLIATKPIR